MPECRGREEKDFIRMENLFLKRPPAFCLNGQNSVMAPLLKVTCKKEWDSHGKLWSIMIHPLGLGPPSLSKLLLCYLNKARILLVRISIAIGVAPAPVMKLEAGSTPPDTPDAPARLPYSAPTRGGRLLSTYNIHIWLQNSYLLGSQEHSENRRCLNSLLKWAVCPIFN